MSQALLSGPKGEERERRGHRRQGQWAREFRRKPERGREKRLGFQGCPYGCLGCSLCTHAPQSGELYACGAVSTKRKNLFLSLTEALYRLAPLCFKGMFAEPVCPTEEPQVQLQPEGTCPGVTHLGDFHQPLALSPGRLSAGRVGWPPLVSSPGITPSVPPWPSLVPYPSR